MTIRSKIILGATPTPATEKALRERNNLAADVALTMSVFEVEIDNTVRYCCWSGGDLIADPAGVGPILPHLTPVGQGACEALMRLPYLHAPDGDFLYTLVFHGVKLGATPLRDKIVHAFRFTADTNAVICFVGDLAKELDGHMSKAFNISDAVDISEITGMRRPGQ